MRELTQKQKKLLTQWFKEKEPSIESKCIFNSVNPIYAVEDLTDDQWEELKLINDTEVLCQNVNCFIHDLRMGD